MSLYLYISSFIHFLVYLFIYLLIVFSHDVVNPYQGLN